MLRIYTKNGIYDWEKDKSSRFPTSQEAINDIIYVKAFGKELEYIREMFTHSIHRSIITTIPITSKSIMIWYGDLAKTIIANLT